MKEQIISKHSEYFYIWPSTHDKDNVLNLSLTCDSFFLIINSSKLDFYRNN